MDKVRGKLVDNHTRCEHYHSELDIIALRFKCCPETYYPCFKCHQETVDHPPQRYNVVDDNIPLVLCGQCHCELTFQEYTSNGYQCIRCHSLFNPGCALHYNLYFEGTTDSKNWYHFFFIVLPSTRMTTIILRLQYLIHSKY